MVNVFDASSLSSKDMRQWLRYNQIAHYLMSRSDFEIKIVRKIKCLICISKGSLLLKHPVGNSSYGIVFQSWCLKYKKGFKVLTEISLLEFF